MQQLILATTLDFCPFLIIIKAQQYSQRMQAHLTSAKSPHYLKLFIKYT